MTYETITYEKQDGIGILTITRPEKRNAISPQCAEEMDDALDSALADDDVKVVIVTGGLEMFCAGADITGDRGPRKRRQSTIVTMVHGLADFEKPTIAAVSGIAYGGGTELALVCDLCIASDTARFALPEIKLGIMPGAGGTQRLPRVIGVARAKEMLFTGDPINAGDAFRMGLVNKVVPVASLMEEAKALARILTQRPPLALRAIKRAVNAGMEVDITSGVRFEQRNSATLTNTEDAQEGRRAFAERRPPVWKGR